VETWDAIRARRNVRSYSEQAIAAQDLDRILEAGRRTLGRQPAGLGLRRLAPTASSSPSWARVWRSAGHVARSAATIALVAPRPDDARTQELIQYDLGQATMSIMLDAADLGIGSAHAAVADQDLARRLLGVPEDRFCAWLITLGVPADRPLTPIQRPNRRPFEEVVHRGHW
jgi:hypothetical protein